MKTDTLFYDLFRIDPRSIFQLADLPVDKALTGNYDFESVTVKTSEKRMDGFFKPKEGDDGPHLFVEVQGYRDDSIYWRLFREVCGWYEQTRCKRPFIAVILFIDERYDPKNRWVGCEPPCIFVRRYLADCLNAVGENSGVLTVLKPLLFQGDKEKLPEASEGWTSAIQSAGLSKQKTKSLIELLEQAILSRFPELTMEELGKMIQLIPLEKTVAGQELISIGEKRGESRGEKRGELRGEKRGESKGKSGIILKILNKKFGHHSPLLEKRLPQSNVDILDRFAEAILDFEDIEDAEKWWNDPKNCGNA